MQTSPITDKTIGIPNIGHGERFSEVRSLSKQQEQERFKSKKKKKKEEPDPKYKIDDQVVLCSSWYGNREYTLVQVIDIYPKKDYLGYHYFGVIKKVTNSNDLILVGHLVEFYETNHWRGLTAANCKDQGIRWVE